MNKDLYELGLKWAIEKPQFTNYEQDLKRVKRVKITITKEEKSEGHKMTPT